MFHRSIAVCGTLLLAPGCWAQNSSNSVQLQLRVVPQSGTLPGAITDQTTSPVIDAIGQMRRFEVQYRVLDLDTSDSIVPAGLAGGELRIRVSSPTGADAAVRLDRAELSRFEAQLAGASPPLSADTSGQQTGTTAPPDQARGLHRPFRGGIPSPAPNNDHPANGTIGAFGRSINGIFPLVLTQTDQGNPNAGQDPTAWYGLYSFSLEGWSEGGGSAIITASFVADATTGTRFGFFNDGDAVPWTSQNAQDAVFRQVVDISLPAPGSVCVLSLAALRLGQRRRSTEAESSKH